MKKVILTIAVLFALTNCEKDNEVEYSSCLRPYVDNFIENNPSSNPLQATIKMYIFNGDIVYLVDFENQNPDSGASVVSSECNPICSLGSVDGKNACKNWENAEYIKTVLYKNF